MFAGECARLSIGFIFYVLFPITHVKVACVLHWRSFFFVYLREAVVNLLNQGLTNPVTYYIPRSDLPLYLNATMNMS